MKWFGLLLLGTVATSRKLYSGFQRCDIKQPDFNACLSHAIPDAIHQLKTPIPQMGLPSMDPLLIPAISISPGSGPMGFEQNYTDFRVWGFMDIECPRIGLDLRERKMEMMCQTKQIRVETNYVFNGTIAVMGFFGVGNGTILLDRVSCFHSYEFEEYLKRSRRHLRVTNSSLEINPKRVSFHFDNLYDGEPVLSENINLVMNDNWREVYESLKPDYEEAFRRVFQALFNSLLARVPISEIFKNG